MPGIRSRLVARRRHLPGLRAQLRRRQRRRHRRPRRRPRPAALPGRPRRRRDLVQPLVPVADGRRRLRRGRLPRHRPGVRHPGRGRGADRRGARARHPDHRRHRAQPQLRPAPVVPGGAGRRAGLARAGPVLVPARPRRATASCRRTTGSRSSAARPGPGSTDPDGTPGEWYLHLFAPEQPDFNWDQPGGPARSSRTSCGSGSTAASTASGSTRAALLVKDPALPDVDPDDAAGPRTRTPTATTCTTSTGPGARSPTPTPAAGADRRGLAARRRSGSPATCARTSCTPRSTSTSSAARGTPPRCATVIDSTLARCTRRSARRPPGCCPTTTWPGTSPGTAAPTPSFGLRPPATTAQPVDLELGTRRARAAALLDPGAARRRSTSTRARSSACGRSRTSRTSCARTRSGTAPAAPTAAGTAAGCRCRGPATSRRSASARRRGRASRGCRSRPTGASLTVEAQAGDPDSMLELYRRALRAPPRRVRLSATAR